MQWPADPLGIDPVETSQTVVEFIRAKYAELNRRKAVLGLSGGLDSSLAAALAVRALGPEKVKLFYLPERDSKKIHRQHARRTAEQLGVALQVINISPALRRLGVYRLLPLSYFPGQRLKALAVAYGRREMLKETGGEFLSGRLAASGGYWVARGNAYASAKHRIRAAVLYKQAEQSGGLVIGAANRTEWLTGTFVQWGCDHSADLMPLLHLFRTQLYPLAEHLGLPPEVIAKKADPDVMPGLDDKSLLLGSFRLADQILWGLEHGYSGEFLGEKFGQDQVAYLQRLRDSSAPYREAPYNLI